MKISRNQLRKLINESIYGSKYLKPRPRDPSRYVSQDVKDKLDPLLTSDIEADRRMGYQLATPLQQDELVFPNDGGEAYEEPPYKGDDYLDDITKYNSEQELRSIVMYLSEDDINTLKSITGKDLYYDLAGWAGATFEFPNGESAIDPDDLRSMIIKVAAKKKTITQNDIDEHEGMDTEVEAVHKIIPAIISLSNKTSVHLHSLEDLGIGEAISSHEYPEIEFFEQRYKNLHEAGKLVVIF